eukprot:CAMPEP_0179312002 /NCGR_PEP_ID=MMETSP0797-20121207/53004_1 /TAXON_ID=47934 /ORGANISM="Dinophysis acuminata, Strain DAEP01" /LENGTH=495 /DNA_ID=CAMNT_0021021847 /DNA_START=24 /DNA_END=1511 /DNA_ORIENTATION=-
MECLRTCVAQLCSSTKQTPGSHHPHASHSFAVDNRKPIRECYKLHKEIGTGSYGSVCTATRKVDQSLHAVKTISKVVSGRRMDTESLKKLKAEVQIMKCLDHPGIVKLHETFEDAKNFYLVMELCNGGELFDRIVAEGHFKESHAAIVMKQMIGAVYYMHKNGICHRDLKPENFLFSSKAAIEGNTLKLIDFGLSAEFTPGGAKFSTRAGTPYYVAPQVLEGRYNELCDTWSCGVIMYVLLCGYPPFYHPDSDQQVLKQVKSGRYSYDPKDWAHVSQDAKNLIDKMLTMSPSARYTAERAYNHVWIQEKAPRAADVALPSCMLDKMRAFRGQNRLKKASLRIIAGLLSEDKIKKLQDLFKALDKNGDGMLSAAELEAGIKSAGIAHISDDLQHIFQDLDTDHSGTIDYSEFLAAALDQHHYFQEDVCWSAFCAFDTDGNGKISKEELLEVLKVDGEITTVMGKQCVDEVMAEVDKDGNGEIDFQEFMQMMRNATK